MVVVKNAARRPKPNNEPKKQDRESESIDPAGWEDMAILPAAHPQPRSRGDRPNAVSHHTYSLESRYHVRRRPWETGNVHAPVTACRVPFDEQTHPIKALWQSNAYLPDKIVRRGPISFVLQWPDDKDVVRLDADPGPPVFPLFYTQEGYVYVPKKVMKRGDKVVTVKYVEFWGWSWEPTRSPPRELLYKANAKTGLHAVVHDKQPTPRQDLGINFTQRFREEVKIMELLGMTGSRHFASMVGFPEHSESGFLTECVKNNPHDIETLEELSHRSYLDVGLSGRVWNLVQCLAKACAVMAWGSEYPDFPVEGWNQIIHLDLTPANILIIMAPDYGHMCGGPDDFLCAKITNFSSALRWPAGNIVSNPWGDLGVPGTENPFRVVEVRRELALKEHQDQVSTNLSPERAQALADKHDSSKDDANRKTRTEDASSSYSAKDIKGNYSWWTNIYAIGNVMESVLKLPPSHAIYDLSSPPAPQLSYTDMIVPDESLGVTGAASLSSLTYLEQETYWRRHADSDPVTRLQRVIARCTAENPRDRITIPELLLECVKGIAESTRDRWGLGEEVLDWEEDGQRILIANAANQVGELTRSKLWSSRDIGLRLFKSMGMELSGLYQGEDEPRVDDDIKPFEIRRDDRQKWDEVARKVFVDENEKPAAKRVTWMGEGAGDEDSDHEIDCLYGAQMTDVKQLERYAGKLGRWDVSKYTG